MEGEKQVDIGRRNKLQDGLGFIENATYCGDCGGLIPRDDAYWGFGKWWHNSRETCEKVKNEYGLRDKRG